MYTVIFIGLLLYRNICQVNKHVIQFLNVTRIFNMAKSAKS
ncbi:hypothetical protein X975_12545, partial [Stegodyphus mimosarum]